MVKAGFNSNLMSFYRNFKNILEISIDQIRSILSELARYHATTFHFLETYGRKGADSFIDEYPSFALEGWMNESTEEGRKESELLFSPLIPVSHYLFRVIQKWRHTM